MRLARSRTRPRRHSNRTTALLVVLAIVLGSGAAGVGVIGLTATTTLAVLGAGLPDPTQLDHLAFAQPTIVYDRSGKVELARFQSERRSVIRFDDIPRLALDATTTAEDRTFWTNTGYDLPAILAAVVGDASGSGQRGASTITQQLVRARLLPDGVVAAGSDRYLRKAKEILQSMRLNDAFPGEQGKERIITAYLNEIFYGHEAYGIAAAADVYFGIKDLNDLSLAQAALLAGLPKAPTVLDPYRFAEKDAKGRLIVPPDSPPVVRRNWVLAHISTSRWTHPASAEVEAALAEPVVLAGMKPPPTRAGHFTWQVRRQLQQIVGDNVPLDQAGLRVTTTLDWKAQSLAERWVTAAVIAPNLKRKDGERLLKRLKIPKDDLGWIRALRGKDVHNAAFVALDYRTGDVLAYLGSAGYGRNDLASSRFEPKFDAAGDGFRQPGSAFKPIVYAAAFDQRVLTPGSLLLDITTEFNPKEEWAPRDADRGDRGPVLVRRALQQSLNTATIRALQRVGNEAVADHAKALGIEFLGGRDAYLQSGLAGALGTVEVRPLDLTSAYGALANGGLHVPPRMLLEVQAADGTVIWRAPQPEGQQAVSPQAAYLVTDILAGNTDPRINEAWGSKLQVRNGPQRSRRPAAAKTGTAQDARDLSTYGYLPPPDDPTAPALAVGVWLGNSDHSLPARKDPAISLTAAVPLWHAFVRDYTKRWPVVEFQPPRGLVTATIDAWSGGKPGPWTHDTTEELFIDGTQPGAREEIDPAGLLYRRSCGQWRVNPLQAELGPESWDLDVRDWIRRAHRGVGVAGRFQSMTAHLPGESSWGGRIIGTCAKPKADAEPGRGDKGKPDKPGRGGGGGGGGGGGAPDAT